MAVTSFVKQDVEVGYETPGRSTKQSFPNVKETVDPDKMVALGQLFVEMLPEGIEVSEVVTVKRMRHQTA
ncbi:hypothetical protein [uncultured Vagococcus sp.]|uniref:hypothetical protein n=1 Tax=uncultured Vagococcus sp. TaxID=189676 RepID=UPI0028D58EA3|nr:hypothetical protein [uncultured Vagococcus sp.]